MNIGQNIKKIRIEHKLSQQAFGDVFNVTQQTVSNWENEKSFPDLETLVLISDKFDCSLDLLLKENLEMVRRMDMERKASKRRKKLICVLAVIVLLFLACTCTDGMALRTAVFFTSPKSAVPLSYEKRDYQGSFGNLYEITQNEPVEKMTEGHLYTWIVYHFGPFHFAHYYGEG